MPTKKEGSQNVEVSVNLDTTPIYYTDNINIVANENGVVLNIMQKVGTSNQMRIVSRIGMSREHAQKFVQELGKLLIVTKRTPKDPENLN